MKLRAVLAGSLVVASVSGCGVFRDGAVHPSVNDCVAAIPVGQALVGKGAHLAQLRRLSLVDVQHLLTKVGAPKLVKSDARPANAAGLGGPSPAPSSLPKPPAGGPQPCVLVFSGGFTSAGLSAAPGISGARTGTYVLLVTTTRHPRVLRTVITATDPLS